MSCVFLGKKGSFLTNKWVEKSRKFNMLNRVSWAPLPYVTAIFREVWRFSSQDKQLYYCIGSGLGDHRSLQAL